jgi:lysophospholipase L1-like esterase
MTPKQRQAAIVCAVCALAVVLTASITGVLVSKKVKAVKGQDESSIAAQEGYDASAYAVSGDAVLGETADAGDDYVADTLFIGDSNTLRYYNNGLITVQQFCAEEGLGVQDAATKEMVAFKGDSKMYSIPDAIAMMKPRRVLITLGTNNADGGMSKDDYISNYKTLVQAIQSKYQYTDIIVNAIPPVPASHDKYANIDQGTIDQMNMALASMCSELNVHFLNSPEALKDESGYGNSSYYVENDIHFTMNGLKSTLKYYRTHKLDTKDSRPDTNNIPKRTQSFTSGTATTNPGTPNATPTPTATAGKYTASYFVDASGGGTLSCGNDTGKTSLKYDVTDEKNSFTVTAVPKEGYFFIKWSDGVKTAERTDKDFKQNVNVTAVFGTLTIEITSNNASNSVLTGTGLSYTAKLSSDKYSSTDEIIWYANGKQVDTGAGGNFTLSEANTYQIYAAVTINKTVIKSNTLSLTVTAPTATPAPTPTPVPAPSLSDISGGDSMTVGTTQVYSVAIQNNNNCTVKWSSNPATNENTGISYTFSSGTPGTYTITATLFDTNGNALATKTKAVTVNAAVPVS